MSEDASLKYLQTQLNDALAKLANRKEQAGRHAKEKAAAEARVKELEGQLAAVTTERDTFKSRAEALPGENEAKITKLEGEIRTRDHRDAFRPVLGQEFAVKGADGKEKKYKYLDKAPVETLWNELKYKADGEVPAPESIRETLGKAVASHPYLFTEVTAAAGATPAPQSREGTPPPLRTQGQGPGPGAGRTVDNAPPPNPGDRIARMIAQNPRAASGKL